MQKLFKPAALTAAAIIAISIVPATLPASAAPATAAECVQAGQVWVSVQYDSKVTGKCAEKFSTASEALVSTGLTTETGEMVTTIDGRKADATSAREWWAVYTKTPKDGAYPSAWDFAQVGVQQLKLAPSDVLAVVMQPDWNLDATAPTTDPVAGVTLEASTTDTTPGIPESGN